jgi:hypothetical protein
MEWTANTGKKMFTPSDKQIVTAYSAIPGYNPVTGANDNGAVEIDVLNYRQSGIAGHKIGVYVAFEPANHTHITDSVHIFDGCSIGLQLPISAQAQVQNHQPWSVPPGGATGDGKPGSWGGHAVPVVAYDPGGVTVVSWGALQTMTLSFWEAYGERVGDHQQRLSVKKESQPARFEHAAVAGGPGGCEVKNGNSRALP